MRQRRALLEHVSEADQAGGPGRSSKGTVVVAAATPHPRPGCVPGQHGHDSGCIRHVPLLELIAERLENAEGAGPEVSPAPMLDEAQRLPADAGKVDSFAGRERRRDQHTRRNFVVGGDVRDQRAVVAEGREVGYVAGHGLLGRCLFGSRQRQPSPAHLLPDCSFRAVHPASSPDRDGRRWSVSGHAMELPYAGSRLRKHDLRLRLAICTERSLNPIYRSRVEHLHISEFAVLSHHHRLNRPIGPAAPRAAGLSPVPNCSPLRACIRVGARGVQTLRQATYRCFGLCNILL